MESNLELADSFIETGRYKKAIEVLDEIIASENNLKAYQMRGYAYFCMHNFDNAVSDLQHVVDQDKEADLANYYLSQLFALAGDYEKAKKYLEQAMAIDEENSEYLADYITVEQSMKNFEHSIELCNQLLEQIPDNVFALNARGFAFLKTDNFDAAITDFETAAKESPYDFSSWNNLGTAFLKKGKEDEAYRYFQTSLRLNPRNPDACSNIGHLHYKRNDHRKALLYINKAIEFDSTNPDAYKNRALVYIATNEQEKAKSDLERAKELGYSDDYDDEVDNLLRTF